MSENVMIFTLDAVRPDRFSCYGYNKIKTVGIDEIANDGVLFKNCIATSCLTPVAHASILSGKNPDKTGVRDPFNVVKTKLVSEILKNYNYTTAGFIGIDLIDSKHKFNKGFDHFDETSKEDSFHSMWFQDKEQKLQVTLGSWWVDRFFKWLDNHYSEKIFVWGHYFHAHFLAEKDLLFSKKLDPNKNTDHAYYDAKIEYLDRQLFIPLIKKLKEYNIWDNTTIIITSDHGETLGPTNNLTWKTYFFDYPQHKTMYESDLKIPLIIKNQNLPKKSIDHTVRSIDIVPTIIDLLNITTNGKFDGKSLLPLIQDKKFPELIAYSEDLFENRGKGSVQSVRIPRYKLIRNVTKNLEEFYNLKLDPNEKQNIIFTTDPNEKQIILEFRNIMEKMYNSYKKKKCIVKDRTYIEKEMIKEKIKEINKKLDF